MAECFECAYLKRPTYKWPCCSCRETDDGRSMFVPTQKEPGMAADCPYCLETGNDAVVVKALDRDNQVEIKVVADKNPRLDICYFNDGWLATWSVGMRIKYCPMCGRKLTDG